MSKALIHRLIRPLIHAGFFTTAVLFSSVVIAQDTAVESDENEDEVPSSAVIIDWIVTTPDDTAPPATRLYVEPLAPLDIEVFEREVYYYEFLNADAANNAAPTDATAN